MSGYTLAWIAWLAAFGIIEGMALANKRSDDTLSEHTRRWFAVDTRAGRTAFGVAWVGFGAWFLGHILKWWP